MATRPRGATFNANVNPAMAAAENEIINCFIIADRIYKINSMKAANSNSVKSC